MNYKPEIDPEDDPEMYPKGIKWYDKWISADYYLPRGYMLPVQVETKEGTFHLWATSSQDWRPVIRWRKVQLTQGTLRKLRAQAKVLAMDEILT